MKLVKSLALFFFFYQSWNRCVEGISISRSTDYSVFHIDASEGLASVEGKTNDQHIEQEFTVETNVTNEILTVSKKEVEKKRLNEFIPFNPYFFLIHITMI
ncbi:hypothetical protein HMI55_002795 [Coelomomyces lativittatus]|nr:hypothetical protein HMI55_002795 [Coelomomyces lativittatus]